MDWTGLASLLEYLAIPLQCSIPLKNNSTRYH
jgi:hypothetical protein